MSFGEGREGGGGRTGQTLLHEAMEQSLLAIVAPATHSSEMLQEGSLAVTQVWILGIRFVLHLFSTWSPYEFHVLSSGELEPCQGLGNGVCFVSTVLC